MIPDLYSNPIMLTDFYNGCHSALKVNKDWEVSHIYNRAAPMVLFGFNATVTNLLNRKITKKNINDAEKLFLKAGLPDGVFPREMWMSVVKDFGGYAPICVEAIPDGCWVPKGTPFAQVYNTEKGFGELVTWWESLLLQPSFASGCATRAYKMRQYLLDNNYPLTKFHDFGARGANSMENSYLAALAWALFLPGSDTVHVLQYGADICSIMASAHKVVQQFDNEFDAYFRAIDVAAHSNKKIVSIPIDTYNSEYFIKQYATILQMKAIQSNVALVFRPDSGNVFLQTVLLWEEMVKNGDGVSGANHFRNAFRVIIGEGMTFEKAKEYDFHFEHHYDRVDFPKIPVDRIAYGIGAGFFKDIGRDTLGWAMKTAYSNGKDRMKFSDDPIKQSIPGKVRLVIRNSSIVVDVDNSLSDNGYHTIYSHNGKGHLPMIGEQTYENIAHICKIILGTHQQEIILSEEIKKKILDIRKAHLK